MTAATIQPPHISIKQDKKGKLDFLYSRMRSYKYVIIALCALLLFGTALYFIAKEKHQEQINENKNGKVLPYDKLLEKKEGEQESVKAVPEGKDKDFNVNQNNDFSEEKYPTMKYTEKEGEITSSEGAVFLKSVLKGMVCVMGELSPYSVSCCGKLSLYDLNNALNDEQGCLIMDSYQIDGLEDSNNRNYRLRFIIENDLIIYEDSHGFPQSIQKCYQIPNYPWTNICASINLMAVDNDFSDVAGYNTCTFMNFGYGAALKDDNSDYFIDRQLLGYAEDVKCSSSKEKIMKKSLNTPFGVVLRLKLEPQENKILPMPDNDFIYNQPINNGVIFPNNELLGVLPINNQPQEFSQNYVASGVPPAFIGSQPLIPNSNPINDSPSLSPLNFTEDNLDLTSAPIIVTDSVSMFDKILNFIRNHILSIFYSRF